MLAFLAGFLGGTVAMRLLFPRWPWVVCAAAGNAIGSASLGLVCLLLAHFVGLNRGVVLAASYLFLLAPLWFARKNPARAKRAFRENRPRVLRWETIALLLAAAFFVVYFRALLHERSGEWFIGAKDAWADLPYHFAIVQGFVSGENFPPRDPLLSETRLAYPYLVDFVAALFVKSGLSLISAFWLQNVSLALSLVVLLSRLTWKLSRSRLASALAPMLLFCGGGLGFSLVWQEKLSLARLPHDYTEVDGLLHFGNPLVYWYSSMRGMLLGATLLIAACLLCFEALNGHERRRRLRLTLAGFVCGLLPLAHAHTFASLLLLAPLLALCHRSFRRRTYLRDWGGFFAVAALLAAPQLWCAASGSRVAPGRFFGWNFGWMRGEFGVVEYWLWNTGAFWPLLLVGLLAPVRGLVSDSAKRFWAPFSLCFLVPNLVKLAPWEWDSIKVLAVWYTLSCPIVAVVVVKIGRRGVVGTVAAALLTLCLCGSGALDIWRVVSGQAEARIYDVDQLAFADLIEKSTAPTDLVLSAASQNPAHQLAGRRTFLGYPGFLWTHGLEYREREADLRTIYAGGPKSLRLLKRYKIDAVAISPMERDDFRNARLPLNEPFFARFPRATHSGAMGPHTLYRITARRRR